jgi:hypothetical protein
VPNCLWAETLEAESSTGGNCVCTDVNGNVYVTGFFYTDTITFGTFTLTGGSVFIVKYSPNGTVLWAKSAGGSNYILSESISTDLNGNVIFTGNFQGTSVTFDTTTLSNNGSLFAYHTFLVKYAPDGTVIWAKSIDGNDNRVPYAATDANGNVILTGFFSNANITIGTTTLTNNSIGGGGLDIYIVKYAPDGTMLWAKSGGGPGNDFPSGICTDASGNVYITGTIQGPSISFDTTTITNSGTSSYDYNFIVKYASDGTVVWATSNDVGGLMYPYTYSLVADATGNIYLSGSYNSSAITIGTTTLTNAGYNNVFIVKYASNGTVIWAKAAGGNFWCSAKSVSTDASGNVYVTGFFSGSSITFGSITLTIPGAAPDVFIVKYASDGTVLWATTTPGSNSDARGNSISLDVNDNIYVTGEYIAATITFGTITISNPYNSGSSNMRNFFIAKYAGIVTSLNEQLDNTELNIYPNPSSSTITFTSPTILNTNLTITNLTGKQVATYNIKNTSTETIDVSNLAEGVYFVSLKSDEGVVTKKMVKTN